MISFCCHAHRHSEFSPLDGTGTANQYAWKAANLGHTHLGLTDHGRLGGILEHVNACRHPENYDHPFKPGTKRSVDERIIPILGLEAFYRPDRFMELPKGSEFGKNPHNWAQHLCLHAGSLQGWKTLMRLSSKSWERRETGGGFYGKACVDMAMLADDHEDLVISTACLASPLAKYILAGDDVGAKKLLKRFRRFSKNGIVWLEIMPHDLDEQRELNIGLVNLAQDTGDPLIATGDVHTVNQDWVLAHQVVRMVAYKSSFKHIEAKKDAGEDVYTDAIDSVYFSSGKEMYNMFKENHPDLPGNIVKEALANTELFTKQFKWYTISKATKAPKLKLNAEQAVRKWIAQGKKKKYREYPADHWDKWSKESYEQRREYEFQVLKEKGVLDYFYIVGDFVKWAKSTDPLPGETQNKRPIRVGLGRGSAAGSLVSHDIGITAIDPIPHKLLFERFLNPDREGYPDIDIDFETDIPVLEVDGKWLDGRDCVKEYLRRTYGHDRVVDVVAYQTFSPKVLIKEVGAVFDLSYGYLNNITESLEDNDRGLEKIAAGNPDKDIEPVQALCELRDERPEIWEVLLKLEDQVLRASRHAGGVIITSFPIVEQVPTQKAVDEETTVTAFADRAEFPILSEYGLLKYDVLGVKSLAKQQVACQLIEQHYGEQFEPNDLPALRDPNDVEEEVMDVFRHGLTVGVFQFSGRGITQLLRHIRPDNATDVAVANALYRPGPIKIAFEYGDRKLGKVPITYWHDSLEPILGETLGLMCFQEQAMEVVKQLAGFTGGDADKFRKIMSKLYRLPGDKAQEIMQNDHDKFIHGCMTISGLREEAAELIWTDRMLPLGNYLFNRSHSDSYGLQAIQDAHIKVHWPSAFYASALTITKKQKKEDQQDWLKSVFREAAVFDIEVTPPDVNASGKGWGIDGNKVRYGLVAVDGLGDSLAQHVIENQPYEDYYDLIDSLPSRFSSGALVALAKSGALDNLEDRRYLLSRARQWDSNVTKLNIKMSCGHLRTRTIKPPKVVAEVIEEVVCKTHPDATIEEVNELDGTYEVAKYIKEHPNEEPIVIAEPTDDELVQMQDEALGISLSTNKLLIKYREYIDNRVFDQEEIDELDEGEEAVVGGEITHMKQIITKKKQQPMAFITLSLGVNQYSVVVFPNQYARFHKLMQRQTLFLFSVKKDDRGSLICDDIVDAVQMAQTEEKRKVVSIDKKRRRKAA
jgi:DNA polymerase-3 subunit alpha